MASPPKFSGYTVYISNRFGASIRNAIVLIVRDSFQAHTADCIKKKKKNTPAVITGGCTSKLQPLDISKNSTLTFVKLQTQEVEFM